MTVKVPAAGPSMPSRQPCCLTIAGSDTGGGAGIQADLKTFAAHDVYGTCVITALTAQNTLGVQAVQYVDPAFVKAQIDSVMDDIEVDCIKIGMLGSKAIVEAVASSLQALKAAGRLPPVVLDPVCVSTSGHRLLDEDALESLRRELLNLCDVLTPNVPELELLADSKVTSLGSAAHAASLLAAFRPGWVYVKGGHMPQEAKGKKVVVDMLYGCADRTSEAVERPFLDSKNTHGTGCTLSSAIAANIARGLYASEAVRRAADYVAGAIYYATPVGRGHGPVSHFHAFTPRTVPSPTPAKPHPFTDRLLDYAPETWERYVSHPFPAALASGKAPLHSFLHFIKQDYHFLKQYGRTHSLAAYKTEDMQEMQASMEIVATVCRETEMHVRFCERHGISREELMQTPESIEGTAYSRYVLDTSMRGDLLDGRVVTAACLIGYGHVGKRLSAETDSDKVDRSENNPYWEWVKEYGSDWYQTAVQTGIDLLEKTVADSPISAKRLHELCETFKRATELEIAFWDAALDAKPKQTPDGTELRNGQPQCLPDPPVLSAKFASIDFAPFTARLLQHSADPWKRYTHHAFPGSLAAGTAPLTSFLHFIRQGYLYIRQYARVYALCAFKTHDIAAMQASADVIDSIAKEMDVNIAICERHGITREELLATPESIECTAYSRYMLDVVQLGNELDSKVVTLACLVGYGEVGQRLCSEEAAGVDRSDKNPYWSWIKQYGSDAYAELVRTGIASVEKTAAEADVSWSRMEELCEIFRRTVALEIAFWDEAMAAGGSTIP